VRSGYTEVIMAGGIMITVKGFKCPCGKLLTVALNKICIYGHGCTK
jgi:hypothetical protein